MQKPNATLQENILALLAFEPEEGRIIAKRLDPALCEGDYRLIAERYVDFWRRYDKPPGVAHYADPFAEILEDKHNRRAPTLRRILRTLHELWSVGINRKYVMDNFDRYTRTMLFMDATLKAAEKLNSKQEMALEEVEALWNSMIKLRQVEFEGCTKLFDIDQVIESVDRQAEFCMGIQPLDDWGVCPARGQLLLLEGAKGFGKTWGLIHIGKQAVMQRKRVLHVSLEMDEPEVQRRYLQSFFSVTSREREVPIATLEKDEDGALEGIGEGTLLYKKDIDFTFKDSLLHLELQHHAIEYAKYEPYLRIKRFPTSWLTVDALEAFIDALEVAEKFIPDMVVIDYPKLMRTDPKNLRISLGRITEELRGMAQRRNFALCAAAQGNREALTAALVRTKHIGEDISQVQTADVVITISQTEQEKRLGLARLFVENARGTRDKFVVLVTQAYAVGQFAIDAVEMPDDYFDHLREISGDDDDEEEEEEEFEDD